MSVRAVRARLPAVLAVLLLGLAAAGVRAGGSPIEVVAFDDPAEAALYRELIAELRCPKCLNTSIAGSDAPIAADLRLTVERQVREGRSREEILAWLQARYGNFILYDPPLAADTAWVWGVPVLLLVAGLAILLNIARSARGRGPATLTADESARLAALLGAAGGAAPEPAAGRTGPATRRPDPGTP